MVDCYYLKRIIQRLPSLIKIVSITNICHTNCKSGRKVVLKYQSLSLRDGEIVNRNLSSKPRMVFKQMPKMTALWWTTWTSTLVSFTLKANVPHSGLQTSRKADMPHTSRFSLCVSTTCNSNSWLIYFSLSLG